MAAAEYWGSLQSNKLMVRAVRDTTIEIRLLHSYAAADVERAILRIRESRRNLASDPPLLLELDITDSVTDGGGIVTLDPEVTYSWRGSNDGRSPHNYEVKFEFAGGGEQIVQEGGFDLSPDLAYPSGPQMVGENVYSALHGAATPPGLSNPFVTEAERAALAGDLADLDAALDVETARVTALDGRVTVAESDLDVDNYITPLGPVTYGLPSYLDWTSRDIYWPERAGVAQSGSGTTHHTTMMQNAASHARADGKALGFRSGFTYRLQEPVWTGRLDNTANMVRGIQGNGARLRIAHPGIGIDMSGHMGLEASFEDFYIIGDATDTPLVGLYMARSFIKPDGIAASAGLKYFKGITTTGFFRMSGMYSVSCESNLHVKCYYESRAGLAGAIILRHSRPDALNGLTPGSPEYIAAINSLGYIYGVTSPVLLDSTTLAVKTHPPESTNIDHWFVGTTFFHNRSENGSANDPWGFNIESNPALVKSRSAGVIFLNSQDVSLVMCQFDIGTNDYAQVMLLNDPDTQNENGAPAAYPNINFNIGPGGLFHAVYHYGLRIGAGTHRQVAVRGARWSNATHIADGTVNPDPLTWSSHIKLDEGCTLISPYLETPKIHATPGGTGTSMTNARLIITESDAASTLLRLDTFDGDIQAASGVVASSKTVLNDAKITGRVFQPNIGRVRHYGTQPFTVDGPLVASSSLQTPIVELSAAGDVNRIRTVTGSTQSILFQPRNAQGEVESVLQLPGGLARPVVEIQRLRFPGTARFLVGMAQGDISVPGTTIAAGASVPFTMTAAGAKIGDSVEVSFAARTAVSAEAVTIAAIGNWYNLPTAAGLGAAVVFMTGVTVTNSGGGTTYAAETDYRIDYGGARIRALQGGAITAGQQVLVTYSYFSAALPAGLVLRARGVTAQNTIEGEIHNPTGAGIVLPLGVARGMAFRVGNP